MRADLIAAAVIDACALVAQGGDAGTAAARLGTVEGRDAAGGLILVKPAREPWGAVQVLADDGRVAGLVLDVPEGHEAPLPALALVLGDAAEDRPFDAPRPVFLFDPPGTGCRVVAEVEPGPDGGWLAHRFKIATL